MPSSETNGNGLISRRTILAVVGAVTLALAVAGYVFAVERQVARNEVGIGYLTKTVDEIRGDVKWLRQREAAK